MNGQWVGEYSGSNSGTIIINVDELLDTYKGIAYIHDGSNLLPSTAVIFETLNKENNFSIEANIFPINPQSGFVDDWKNVRSLFPQDVIFPDSVSINGSFTDSTLKINWQTNIGTVGQCEIKKIIKDRSTVIGKKLDWDDFKKYLLELDKKKYIFRGQSQPWPLQTAFHRHGRSDLSRFLNEDVPMLHRKLSARTQHFFDLKDPDQNGAFFNLIQHHGYPTPLLDWTYSPYVAAFFAYQGISNKEASEKYNSTDLVRIFIFDKFQWQADLEQISWLLTSRMHLSLMEFLAINNERMIPQQALSAVTNIDDIEKYINMQESIRNKKYLSAVDLPVLERNHVMKELQYMGITSGSLFPGIDGSCRELKERNFIF